MTKRVLMTGVTGFIGRNLAVRLVNEGWEVHAIVRNTSKLNDCIQLEGKCVYHLSDGEINSLIAILGRVRPDVVFHLASLYIVDHVYEQIPSLINSNISLGVNLLEAMVATNCLKIINAGTSWQNYQCDTYRPVNLYAATKQAFEDILAYYCDAKKVASITLRLFDTYGPNDQRKKVLNLIVDALLEQKILGMSPGEQVIDISNIDDVVESFYRAGLHILASNSPSNDVFFVSGEQYTLRSLVASVAAILGKNYDCISFGKRAYREREVMSLPNVKELTAPWDNFPRKSLREGVLSIIKASS
ncbi:NAD-dependent epimerase/dehydratase family protein [Stutzerimonas nitrititolerans]|uniref:NAD-dependent epimerase/dehydratase family protein n=1 Tax=Stutzerimonas nitrititolerans TaxID=2482751 RepID=UPI00289D0061|nr:NAD(P)-dependent oxidoreductase [Stutzerimonas nitrititolerans]